MDRENTKKGADDLNEYIEFEEGIFGFEQEKRFLPVALEEGSDAIVYLQSAENEELSFVMMKHFLLKEDYNPELGKED